jgi:hypothetical protein
MITEDYVSFETAKLLKEKGFSEKVISFYPPGDIQRPTLQMAMKWLREVHKIFIHIAILNEPSCWLVDIQDIKNNGTIYPVEKGFPNYEEACEGAIKCCLENLI